MYTRHTVIMAVVVLLLAVQSQTSPTHNGQMNRQLLCGEAFVIVYNHFGK